MSRLTVKDNGYYLDGRPFRIISGAIHYFRVVPEYWEDRLLKLCACGMNTLETYTCWNLHERRPGEFDFKGRLDLARFLRTAQELGLFVILRPGPYICSEWDKGGLPAWLETVPGMELRCYNRPFLDAVERYFRRLFDEIRPYLAVNGGPVIAVQIENEYGSYGDDHQYMAAVRDILRSCGVEELTFTSDGPGYFMLNGGSLPDSVATVNFGSNPRDNFALLSRFRPGAPIMCTEYWNGWFDHWYEEHHTRQSGETADVMREMLDMGASVNMYMFHGGTNFGFLSGANYDGGLQPMVTSYDYNCPVSECGDLTDKYWAVRDVVMAAREKLGDEAVRSCGDLQRDPRDIAVQDLPKRSYGRVELKECAELFDNVDALRGAPTVGSRTTESFEKLGADFGYMLYQTELQGPFETLELSIDGLADRASVYVTEAPTGAGREQTTCRNDRRCLGIKENTGHRDDRIEFGLDFGESAELDILVENMGHVNYGGHIRDLKGITGGVRFANCYHYGWRMTWLPMDDLSRVAWRNIGDAKSCRSGSGTYSPMLYRGVFTVDECADTFLELPGFHKGTAYINGFNLGRYWNDAGPQRTLYIPAPLLKTGENELIVFETDGAPETQAVVLRDTEILG